MKNLRKWLSKTENTIVAVVGLLSFVLIINVLIRDSVTSVVAFVTAMLALFGFALIHVSGLGETVLKSRRGELFAKRTPAPELNADDLLEQPESGEPNDQNQWRRSAADLVRAGELLWYLESPPVGVDNLEIGAAVLKIRGLLTGYGPTRNAARELAAVRIPSDRQYPLENTTLKKVADVAASIRKTLTAELEDVSIFV